MPKGQLPGIKYKSQKLTVTDIQEALIVLMELSRDALDYLGANNRLTPQINFRLQVEVNNYVNILEYICKVKDSYVQGVITALHADEKKYEERVKEFCESIVPGGGESTLKLFTAEDMRRQTAFEQQKRGMVKEIKTGRRIITP